MKRKECGKLGILKNYHYSLQLKKLYKKGKEPEFIA